MEYFSVYYIVTYIIYYANGYAYNFLMAFLISAVIYLMLLVLQGFGLYVMAKDARLPHAWMAFVPFLNDYLTGRLAGDCAFFGRKIKHCGIYYAVSDGVYTAAQGVYLMSFILVYPYMTITETSTTYYYSYVGVPDALAWAVTLEDVFYYVSYVLEIVAWIFMILVIFTFFRKYSARFSTLFTITTIILPPAKCAFVFAVRKNKPIDYERYVREKNAEYYRRQQQYYSQPNPYETDSQNQNRNQSGSRWGGGQGGGQSNSGQQSDGYQGEDPFSEFSENGDSSTTDVSGQDQSENDEFFN